MSTQLEFGVLGPLQVLVNGEELPVRAGRHRALLVSLLLRAGAAVSVDELAVHVWGDDPPARYRGTLQTYVMRLRQALGPAVPIRTVPDGYLVDVDERTLDLARFGPLVEQGEQDLAAGNLTAAAAAFSAALGLWRGPAMVDVPSQVLHRDEVPRLDERRLHALERRIGVDLELGLHALLVPELTALTSQHPLRERFWAQLVLALHRSGRRDEALTAFDRVSRLLADDLGIDPGDELRAAHAQVLRGEPFLERAAVVARVAGPERAVPSQLPADIGDFVGRDRAARLVEALLLTAQNVPVVALAGPPGVGKTALAVHCAHRLRARFPDGQLYVNLRGYAPGPPLSAVDVLPRFLRALGVAAESIPLDQDEQEAMFRERLTGRRVLLVLDNAATAEQIRPLLPGPQAVSALTRLPGSQGCAVLVTSRDTLRELAVSHAASNVRLDVLDVREARALLAGMLGRDLVEAQPEAADALAELCAHLPLALRIAAANLMSRPDTTIAEYAEELRAGNRLAALAVDGDERIAVHVAFDLSYAALPPELAHLFRLLSVVPGTDITPDVAAAITRLTTQQARRGLDRLAAANLVDDHAPNRYQFHDLLREYAAARLHAERTAQEAAAAFERLVQWSVRSVDNATTAMKTTMLRLPRPPESEGLAPRTFSSHLEAKAWLDAERANLVALVGEAAQSDQRGSWQLADALRGYFYTQGLPAEWLTTAKAGLRAAQDVDDPVGQVAMLSSLGTLFWAIGRQLTALEHYRRAVPLLERAGVPEAEAALLSNLGTVHIDLGELEQAAEHLEHALVITRRIGAHQREAVALFNLGGVYLQLGQLDRAAGAFEGSLAVGTRLGVWVTQANSVRALGEVHALRGRPAEAAEMFRRAGALYERASARIFSHLPHEGMAVVHIMRGDYDEAITEATRARTIAADIGNQKGVCDANNVLGEALTLAGRGDEAATCHGEALRLAEESSYAFGACNARRGLAWTRLAAGDPEEALLLATQAWEATGRARLRLAETDVLVLLGRVRLELGDVDEALDRARRAEELSERSGQRLVHAQAAWLAGDALLAAGDREAALRAWSGALEVFTEVGTPDAHVLRGTVEGVTGNRR
ncbi:AfsR/SARP family transcriptional regulator [Umezawaea beigongshangensis]|uniref:AfsR/SARP family transcriptional regulator n=1 Tax=Umezawaea beigongshangensis TaxID=2780383 RepID=UPI0018F21772|nr:BTAD domain-containing putative transcriptional regulator [Umezawaea beigongshangensis]